MEQKKSIAIVLAAGRGKRMLSDIPKQYLLLDSKPLLYYSLKAFEESSIEEIILVVGENDIEYCRKSIVEEYHFKKVSAIVEGGKERYHSVYLGLKAITYADYILIHDGARPFITVDIIERTIDQVRFCNACVVGVPTKDTIKLVNEQGIIIETPNRDMVWSIQTPQAFSYDIIMKAYETILVQQQSMLPIGSDQEHTTGTGINITDDAMVVEHTLQYPIQLVIGSYRNIKITTPEDINIGEALLKATLP